MAQSLQAASTDLLDVLIQAGSGVLTPEQADKVVSAATTVLGKDAKVDVNQPANAILAQLRPMLVEQVGKMAETFAARAVESVDGLDEKYGKETMMTLWPSLPVFVKALITLMVLATIAVSGYMAYGTHVKYPDDMMDVLIIGVLPLCGLFAFCTWPIKTLAFKSLEITSKVVEAKLQKENKKPAKEA